MNTYSNELIARLQTNPGASEEEIGRLLNYVRLRHGTSLPEEYLDFLRATNGVSGQITPHRLLFLWSVEVTIDLNEDYKVLDWAPGLLLIGSDAGSNFYGIDTRTSDLPRMIYCSPDFLGSDWQDVYGLASSFDNFLWRVTTEEAEEGTQYTALSNL